MPEIKPVLLIILDGFGYRIGGEDNAIFKARTPNWDKLCQQYPHHTIQASERQVGLPLRQFGNSEVGHLNIGAGRIVDQDITRIDKDIEQGQFARNPVIAQVIQQAAQKDRTLHVIGLLSDGGVHSHENHFHALIHTAIDAGVHQIKIHAFLDGRDTPPRSAKLYLQRLDEICNEYCNVSIASICGRYWSMDRDKRWDRIEQAYQLLVNAKADYQANTAQAALEQAYVRGENDEFVKPTLIIPPSPIKNDDVVIFMNFRADRARELTSALTDPDFSAFSVTQPKLAMFASIGNYGNQYHHAVAYPPHPIHNGFGEYLSSIGLKQLRIAETEKYPHVTYFFNGGEEKEYPGEDRILIPSPKVATYDLQPEMSAYEVIAQLIKAIESEKYAAIICNFANGDMVGHTGVFSAAVKAVETLDECLGKCVEAMLKHHGEILITADHGNCEKMSDLENNQPHTQHTLNVVPFLYVGRPANILSGGSLRDIAPTLLAMMGLPKPDEMTGKSLISWR